MIVSDPETIWLNVTNILLGLVVLISFFSLGMLFFRTRQASREKNDSGLSGKK